MKKSNLRIAVGAALASIALGGVTWLVSYLRPVADPEEIDAIEARLRDVVRRAEREHCPRPVLRGQPRPGSGGAALRDILDPRGEHAACWQWLEVEAERLPSAFGPAAADGTPESDADLLQEIVAPAPALGASPTRLEQALVERCGPTVAAIRQTLSHEDVCAPFGLAQRDADAAPLLRIARAFVAVARAEARQGRAEAALEVLLDALRYAQDLHRGPSGVLFGQVASAIVRATLGSLEVIVASDLPWTDAMLRDGQREIEALVRAWPLPDRIFAEDPAFAMMDFLVVLGRSPLTGTAARADLPRPSSRLDRAQTEAALLAASARFERFAGTMRCAPEASRADCAALVERALRAAAPRPPEPPSWWRQIAGLRLSRTWLVERAPDELSASGPRYLRRMERAVAAVAAHWVVLEHRRQALRTGRCPGPDELATALQGRIPTEPRIGGRFELEARPDASLEVLAPNWLRTDLDGISRTRLPLARSTCSTRGSGTPQTDVP